VAHAQHGAFPPGARTLLIFRRSLSVQICHVMIPPRTIEEVDFPLLLSRLWSKRRNTGAVCDTLGVAGCAPRIGCPIAVPPDAFLLSECPFPDNRLSRFFSPFSFFSFLFFLFHHRLFLRDDRHPLRLLLIGPSSLRH